MKMVKSLLLGSAAGLVALTGAQAADLPVKAKPVQYVKICSLYGAGFYYIPGTDMCIKVGGWVRFEAAYGDNGNLTNGPFTGNVNNRTTNNSTWRSRGYITVDARDQTAYGTVRGYLAVGINTSSVGADSPTNTFSSNRAFLQWAGFTFGLAQSFYDFYSVPATSYWGSFPASDTGDPGWQVAGYTFQFGNGWSATLSAEQRRTTQIVGQGALVTSLVNGAFLPGTAGFPTGGYGGFNAPDVVGNIRIDQVWGSAQIMGAAHQVNTTYYGSAAGTVPGLGALSTAAVENNGNPSDKWGFAVGGGLKLNAPMIGQGDYFQTQVNYTQGAVRYVFLTPEFNYGLRRDNDAAFGVLTDAVYGGALNNNTATDLQLTTAWNVNAAYEHFWNPQWRTSVYGGYAAVSYNSQANAMLCGLEGQAAVGSTAGAGAVALAGCANNWNVSWIGTRTQWNVTKDFYMGVDVLYQRLDGAGTATGQIPVSTFGFTPANIGQTTFNNNTVDNWSFRFRAHRDFYP